MLRIIPLRIRVGVSLGSLELALTLELIRLDL